ncbi:MAG TPA: TetR/AcrR family transcriptional regulator [Chryseolinea sp.]|nr:TetR/AcrR family transcriptional regulator [Chryseolinea sp.]HPM29723.1 TetR/AcrR family transcriptional regulator [Chryseolinea sp.]
MTKSERTRQFIIEKTAPLFNTKGYEGTSMADLVEVTGLTKGSLYGNFKDKEDISAEAFKYSMRKVREMVQSELDGIPTFKKQLSALCDFYARYVFDPPVPGGCPLLNTAIEADDHRTSIRKVVTKEILSTVNFISDLLSKGVDAGEFKKGIKTNEIAYTFFCSIEGAIMFSRVERSREPMDIIVQHCKSILDQISK